MEERCGQRFKRGPINPSGGKERALKLAYSLQRVIFDRKASSSYSLDTLPTVAAYSSRSRVNIIRRTTPFRSICLFRVQRCGQRCSRIRK